MRGLSPSPQPPFAPHAPTVARRLAAIRPTTDSVTVTSAATQTAPASAPFFAVAAFTFLQLNGGDAINLMVHRSWLRALQLALLAGAFVIAAALVYRAFSFVRGTIEAALAEQVAAEGARPPGAKPDATEASVRESLWKMNVFQAVVRCV